MPERARRVQRRKQIDTPPNTQEDMSEDVDVGAHVLDLEKEVLKDIETALEGVELETLPQLKYNSGPAPPLQSSQRRWPSLASFTHIFKFKATTLSSSETPPPPADSQGHEQSAFTRLRKSLSTPSLHRNQSRNRCPSPPPVPPIPALPSLPSKLSTKTLQLFARSATPPPPVPPLPPHISPQLQPYMHDSPKQLPPPRPKRSSQRQRPKPSVEKLVEAAVTVVGAHPDFSLIDPGSRVNDGGPRLPNRSILGDEEQEHVSDVRLGSPDLGRSFGNSFEFPWVTSEMRFGLVVPGSVTVDGGDQSIVSTTGVGFDEVQGVVSSSSEYSEGSPNAATIDREEHVSTFEIISAYREVGDEDVKRLLGSPFAFSSPPLPIVQEVRGGHRIIDTPAREHGGRYPVPSDVRVGHVEGQLEFARLEFKLANARKNVKKARQPKGKVSTADRSKEHPKTSDRVLEGNAPKTIGADRSGGRVDEQRRREHRTRKRGENMQEPTSPRPSSPRPIPFDASLPTSSHTHNGALEPNTPKKQSSRWGIGHAYPFARHETTPPPLPLSSTPRGVDHALARGVPEADIDQDRPGLSKTRDTDSPRARQDRRQPHTASHNNNKSTRSTVATASSTNSAPATTVATAQGLDSPPVASTLDEDTKANQAAAFTTNGEGLVSTQTRRWGLGLSSVALLKERGNMTKRRRRAVTDQSAIASTKIDRDGTAAMRDHDLKEAGAMTAVTSDGITKDQHSQDDRHRSKVKKRDGVLLQVSEGTNSNTPAIQDTLYHLLGRRSLVATGSTHDVKKADSRDVQPTSEQAGGSTDRQAKSSASAQQSELRASAIPEGADWVPKRGTLLAEVVVRGQNGSSGGDVVKKVPDMVEGPQKRYGLWGLGRGQGVFSANVVGVI